MKSFLFFDANVGNTSHQGLTYNGRSSKLGVIKLVKGLWKSLQKVMDSDGSRHILLSQEEEEEMYKLTYDSDENDEVIAPNTPPGRDEHGSTGYDLEMKKDAAETKENGDGTVPNPNQKRTKDVGKYEGNGRFYSLFANDNFLTEDPKQKRKFCCIGIKSSLFIVAIVILMFAILGMMWVIRDIQIEQNHMRQRIKHLEDSDTSSSSSSFLDSRPQVEEFHVPPGMTPSASSGTIDQQCCTTNKQKIDYLREVNKGHTVRFDEIEHKLKRQSTTHDIRNAELTRTLGETIIDVKTAFSRISGIKENLHQVKAVAESAQTLSLFGMKEGQLTDEQLEFYLQTTTKGGEGVAFSVVHAMGNDHVINHDPQVASDDSGSSSEFYDVGENFAPVISFTQETISGELFIQPESGTFHVPSDGNYVIMINFCAYDDQETSIHLIQNGKAVREMKVSLKPVAFMAADEALVPPPGLLRPPSPPSNDAIFQNVPEIHIRPYQFSEVMHLEQGDTVYLKIHLGSIVEYKNVPGDHPTSESCTRFSGFKLN